jgi:hypothetical protein
MNALHVFIVAIINSFEIFFCYSYRDFGNGNVLNSANIFKKINSSVSYEFKNAKFDMAQAV